MISQGVSARLARLALCTRSEQRSLFGAGVSESDGWEVILVLFIADAEGRRFTVEQVIAEMGGEPEATKRRIAHLSHAGIIVGDGHCRIGDVVTLAPEAVTKVESVLERTWAAIATF